jgi:phosphoribosylformimino-5-aminoimidazole carboxamide ribotide isomerase
MYMRIIPVMDLKGGQVVHAIGGRRDEYRPIQSQLVNSSDPEAIAHAFRDQLKLDELYIADLDAIARAEPACKTYRTLASMGIRLMVDAGIRDLTSARAVQAAGSTGVVVGLETLHRPELLHELVNQLGSLAVWFSLDLREGKPICGANAWQGKRPEQIADQAIRMGVAQLIVLDVASVGRSGGIGTENLCREILAQHPAIEVIAGGGIRDESDLQRLEALGISGALVATAIHTRRLSF